MAAFTSGNTDDVVTFNVAAGVFYNNDTFKILLLLLFQLHLFATTM